MVHKRYSAGTIAQDLKKKMVFIGGPRQVGKTTLAETVGEAEYAHHAYLNWDSREDRRAILDERFDPEATLLIFDELHKYRRWKQYIKGVYDTQRSRFNIIVTGSARL
ncbi:AAA family ATPase, partial [Candidatus Uhrbacteria bacterium]|nr:AAA family ATPase [Candidatus Uhrbacteria bacterium]